MSSSPEQARTTRRRSQRGSTFAELMLATLIVGTTVVASTSSLADSARIYHYFADGPHEALMLAQEIHEAARLLPWEADEDVLPSFGDDVVTLWDLDGSEYSPPRSTDYEIIVSHTNWTQSVVVQTVDLHNPTVVVDPETFEGETLTELVVAIRQGNVLMDTCRWWMAEPKAE